MGLTNGFFSLILSVITVRIRNSFIRTLVRFKITSQTQKMDGRSFPQSVSTPRRGALMYEGGRIRSLALYTRIPRWIAFGFSVLGYSTRRLVVGGYKWVLWANVIATGPRESPAPSARERGVPVLPREPLHRSGAINPGAEERFVPFDCYWPRRGRADAKRKRPPLHCRRKPFRSLLRAGKSYLSLKHRAHADLQMITPVEIRAQDRTINYPTCEHAHLDTFISHGFRTDISRAPKTLTIGITYPTVCWTTGSVFVFVIVASRTSMCIRLFCTKNKFRTTRVRVKRNLTAWEGGRLVIPASANFNIPTTNPYAHIVQASVELLVAT